MSKQNDTSFDDSRSAALLEDMNSKFDAVIELVIDIKRHMATKDELAEVKSDVKIVKAALTHLSNEVDDHAKRLSVVEAR